jgi:hypothetical protein
MMSHDPIIFLKWMLGFFLLGLVIGMATTFWRSR